MKETNSRSAATGKADRSKKHAKLYCSAASYESIRKKEKEIPFEMHSDIAVVYYLQEDRDNGSSVITPITNAMINELGLDKGEIMKRAWKNTVTEKRAVMMSLADLLGEDEEGAPKIYVLSNEEMHLGAVTMFYPGLLDIIADELDGDLCILPSSIHECLILPMQENTDRTELKKIVRKVNDTEVAPEDILSYNVYRYDRQRHCVEIDNF